jgi:DNA replication protein DnaC
MPEPRIFGGIPHFQQLSRLSTWFPQVEPAMLIARRTTIAHTSCMASNDTTPRLESNSPECPFCGGSGWKMVEVVDQFGRNSQKATKCECQRRLHGERLLEQARIPKRYEHCDFGGFEHGGNFKQLAVPFMKSRSFVEMYPAEKDGLMIIGPIGVGKTHLAVSIIKELITQKHVPCLFYDYRELLKTIQNSYNSSVQTTEMAILRPVFDAEVLVLDELGAVRTSQWVGDTVSHILNTRYNDKKTTIITTNFNNLPERSRDQEEKDSDKTSAEKAKRQDTLGDRITERMRSRLNEMCRIIEVQGDDFRLKVKRASFQ